jgi:hypothetical protein
MLKRLKPQSKLDLEKVSANQSLITMSGILNHLIH